jgi:hypothetical protein
MNNRNLVMSTVRAENRFPHEHTRTVSWPVSETTLICIWLSRKSLFSKILRLDDFYFQNDCVTYNTVSDTKPRYI